LDKGWSGIVEDQEEESEGTLSGIHSKHQGIFAFMCHKKSC